MMQPGFTLEQVRWQDQEAALPAISYTSVIDPVVRVLPLARAPAYRPPLFAQQARENPYQSQCEYFPGIIIQIQYAMLIHEVSLDISRVRVLIAPGLICHGIL